MQIPPINPAKMKRPESRETMDVLVKVNRDIGRGTELEGRKYDQNKIRMDLLPPELLEGVADILTFGARKYGDRNWEKGMAWSRPFGALMRHMWAWWRGDKADPETGKSHLWHAACCIAFLMAYEARGTGKDDRPVQDSVVPPKGHDHENELFSLRGAEV